jgi:amino acid adenylation domain-containing protein
MQLEEFLEQSALRMPGKTAVVAGERRWTYREIDALVNQFASRLASSHVKRWDRVVICMENSVEMIVAIFATLKLGAVFVPINPTTKAEKLTYILKDSGARCLITDAVRISVLKNIVETGVEAVVPQTEIPTSMEIFAEPSPKPLQTGIDMDLAALIYTSGSTGVPKGVMLSHLNMVSAATSITTYLENTADDIILNVLPMSFDYGLYQMLMAFKVGATLVLEKRFTFPAAVLNLIAREKVTGFPIIPTISAILLQLDLKCWDLSSLRYLTNTGAVLPGNHIVKLREALPHARIFSMYGLTECKRVSYLPPDQIDVRPDSVGRGMPNEEVYIVNEQGDLVGPNVVGELVIRGANVMQGYWGMPDATERVLKPGRFPWERVLHSGDLFRQDAEGYLYFIGRRDEMIKSRGQKVSPNEIEEVLYGFPGIAEAAVVGIPDPILGTAIRAVVVPQKGRALTEQEVLNHCARCLEDFAVPQSVEFRESLPRTMTGKIAKRELAPLSEAAV